MLVEVKNLVGRKRRVGFGKKNQHLTFGVDITQNERGEGRGCLSIKTSSCRRGRLCHRLLSWGREQRGRSRRDQNRSGAT